MQGSGEGEVSDDEKGRGWSKRTRTTRASQGEGVESKSRGEPKSSYARPGRAMSGQVEGVGQARGRASRSRVQARAWPLNRDDGGIVARNGEEMRM